MPSKHKRKSVKKKSESPDAPTVPAPATRTILAPRKKADRLMMRFYEPLVLQHVLDPTRGNRIQCELLDSLDDPELGIGNCKLRRSFLNSLAYICDYKKGGTTVTAIALEMRPAGVVFWVAANEKVKDEVILFLRKILKDLDGGASSGKSAATVEESTFRSAVELGMPRLKAYWRFMQDHLRECIKALGLEGGQSKDMAAWLSSFKDHQEDMLHLCRFSHDARTSPYMKELTRRSGGGSDQVYMQESHIRHFSMVRHYIRRLGSHKKAARTLVATAMKFPTLFDNFEIKCLPSPRPAERPPMDNLTTLDGIVVRMLPKDDENVPFYQEALQDMDNKFQIHERLVEEYKKSTFLPRVHAELILLEHFHMHQYDFVEGDKYIACSKPACYCCYHYICAHPGNFIRPASHNKVYLNWRPPDVINDDAKGSAAMCQRDIVNDMLKCIRRDVLTQIKNQSGRRRSHPDSTTGITVTAW